MPVGTRSRAGLKARINKLTSELIQTRKERDCLLAHSNLCLKMVSESSDSMVIMAGQVQKVTEDRDFWFAQCKEEVRKRLELETAHVTNFDANPFPPDMTEAEKHVRRNYPTVNLGGENPVEPGKINGHKLAVVVFLIAVLALAVVYLVNYKP